MGTTKGLLTRLPVTYSHGEGSTAVRREGGSCHRAAQSQGMEQRVQEVVQRRAGSDGRTVRGLPGWHQCRVPLSSKHTHACSSAGALLRTVGPAGTAWGWVAGGPPRSAPSGSCTHTAGQSEREGTMRHRLTAAQTRAHGHAATTPGP